MRPDSVSLKSLRHTLGLVTDHTLWIHIHWYISSNIQVSFMHYIAIWVCVNRFPQITCLCHHGSVFPLIFSSLNWLRWHLITLNWLFICVAHTVYISCLIQLSSHFYSICIKTQLHNWCIQHMRTGHLNTNMYSIWQISHIQILLLPSEI